MPDGHIGMFGKFSCTSERLKPLSYMDLYIILILPFTTTQCNCCYRLCVMTNTNNDPSFCKYWLLTLKIHTNTSWTIH